MTESGWVFVDPNDPRTWPGAEHGERSVEYQLQGDHRTYLDPVHALQWVATDEGRIARWRWPSAPVRST